MALLDGARTKVKNGLANFSFFLGLTGGILASVSMIGGWLITLANIGPWWTPLVLFAITFIICVGDWSEGDATPNRRAVYTSMMFPAFFIGSLTGACGAKLFGAIGAIDEKTEKQWRDGFKDWTDLPGDLEDAFTVFSVICIVAAITYAQMYAKKAKAAAAASGSSAPVASRRTAR